MIDHLGIDCADYPKSQQLYDAVLGVLGFSRQLDFGEAVGYGRDGKPAFWISGALAGPNREVHLAFAAADESAVHAFYRAPPGAPVVSRLWPAPTMPPFCKSCCATRSPG